MHPLGIQFAARDGDDLSARIVPYPLKQPLQSHNFAKDRPMRFAERTFRLQMSAERHRHFAFGPRREDIGLKVIASIQCLRAIAALSVVVVHASDHAAGLSGNRHFGEVATIGAAGVDVFFVISGFIMYVTACSRPITGLHFLADRFSRIVPLYWVATFLLMAVVVAGKTPLPPLFYLLASMALCLSILNPTWASVGR